MQMTYFSQCYGNFCPAVQKLISIQYIDVVAYIKPENSLTCTVYIGEFLEQVWLESIKE